MSPAASEAQRGPRRTLGRANFLSACGERPGPAAPAPRETRVEAPPPTSDLSGPADLAHGGTLPSFLCLAHAEPCGVQVLSPWRLGRWRRSSALAAVVTRSVSAGSKSTALNDHADEEASHADRARKCRGTPGGLASCSDQDPIHAWNFLWRTFKEGSRALTNRLSRQGISLVDADEGAVTLRHLLSGLRTAFTLLSVCPKACSAILNTKEEDGGRLVRCYPKMTDGQVDAGTQTDPVVVLSLAQAAVLGLISQNEVFGATIAPNGFYTGEARDGAGEEVKYEYADQLIGANGDYLGEALEEEEEEDGHCAERRRPGPQGTGRRARSEAERATPTETRGRGEGKPSGRGPCVHRAPGDSACSVALKQEQPTHGCPDCEREARAREGRGDGAEEQEGAEGAGSPLKPRECADSPEMSRYFESSEIDRLDINVQIDESYCVDVGEGLRRWKCRMCEKSYTSKYNLVTHILGHNGIKPHECPHCGKLFKQPSHLQTHLLTHQGTRPHKCAVCKKAFTQTSHLKRHMLQHTDVKPYSCRFCRRGFAYPSELRAHETKHESGRCHVCLQCGMELPSLAHLKRHQTSHQGPTTYQCSECNKSFAYRSQLQNHLMKHQNVRPFVCAECGMEFVQIHHLKQHALTHKGMKEFKCDVCSREFTLSANLKRHMLIHASVRPYQCHVCFKTFVQKQTLKTHMIVHLPVKPFKCKVCGKSFNRMYNLLGHMHLHAGSKPFKCPYCSSKFNLKGNLSRHMKVKHGIADLSLDSHGLRAPLAL
ncbi:hypothetical protein AAFF_G00285820 [Aldrovandia affinis]|uniref:Zinc finger protein 710 n=1 Tax=Aldrovandia affinis TaxID=143900 RepID=A0AAD7TAH0_9TELE|nr:hypothetical protein AAFF_G00285820 [Aldrovandia affinis]